jgi:lysophospholipase L1-like esterase
MNETTVADGRQGTSEQGTGKRLGTLVAVAASVLAVTFAVTALRPTQSATSGAPTSGSVAAADGADRDGGAQRWVTGWSANPVIGSVIPFSTCPAGQGLQNQTVRNVVFVSAGGNAVRVRLTNTFGTKAVHIGHASVAVQGTDANTVPGTLRALTFGGHADVTIAAGAEALSDPTDLTVAGRSTLLVSVYVPDATGPVTNHPFTAQGNFLGGGDLTQTASAAGYANTPCWMLIDGVDVRAAQRVVGTVVALGDSITDTANTTGNANRRWPDDLARRLAARDGPTLSVANGGLGGDRLLAPRDGEPYFGIAALARLDRDVFAQTAVRDVIMLIGVNDIGFDATAEQIIDGYRQVIAQTHARGLRIFGGTISGFGGSFLFTPQREAVRLAVNSWIRDSRTFDGFFDFATALADPANPAALRPAYDSGDHLHPNDAGCAAIANAVEINSLVNG